MNKKGQMNSLIIGVFAIIFAIIAVTIGNDIVSAGTTLTSTTQSINYSSAPTEQNFTITTVGTGIDTDTFVLGNTTLNLTVNDDYNITSAGALNIIYATNMSDLTAAYDYQASGYITDNTTRLIVNFIPLFLALAALALAAALVIFKV